MVVYKRGGFIITTIQWYNEFHKVMYPILASKNVLIKINYAAAQ